MKPKNLRYSLLSTALLTALASSPSAFAANLTWGTNLGAGPHTWNTGSNWTLGTAPTTAADRADLRKDWTAAAIINLNAPIISNGIYFDDTGASSDVAVTIGNGAVAANTLTFSSTADVVPVKPYVEVFGTLNISSIITGTDGFTKGGSGKLTLSGVNTYTGGTSVIASSLEIGSIATTDGVSVTGSATGLGNVSMTSGTTLLNNNGANVWYVPTLTLQGTLNLSSGNRLKTTIGTLELGNGTRVMNVNNRFRAVTNGNTVTTEGTGEAQLELNGTAIQATTATIQNGTLSLQSTSGSASSTNPALLSIHGATNWADASLIIGANNMLMLNGSGSANALGSSATTSPAVTVEGYLNFANTTSANKNFKVQSLAGSGKIFPSMLAATISPAINSILTINGSTGSTEFSGVIANGPGTGKTISLTKSGGSTQILSGTNTYTGTTTISAGTLTLAGSGTLGSGADLTLSGGTLDLGAMSTTVGAVSITGAPATGNVLENGSITGSSYAATNTSGNAIVAANLLANGAIGVTKTGAGILTLSGANTYTGTTIVRTGVLDVGTINSGSLGAGGLVISNGGVLQGNGEFTRSFSNSLTPGDGQVSTNDGVNSSSGGFAAKGGPLVVKFGNNTNLVQLSSGSFRFGQGLVFGSSTADNKVTVMNPLSLGGSNRTFTVHAGTGTDSAELAGAVTDNGWGITKAGAGRLIMSAANSYTGNTVITGGVIELADNAQLKFAIGSATGVSNSISGSGNIELNGDFLIDTTAAASLTTGSWTLVSANADYYPTFSVVGFTDKGDGTWTKTSGTQVWTFDEATGALALAAGGSAYDSWTVGKLTGNDALPGSDPDRDGTSNLIEFALNGNPNSASSNGQIASLIQNSSAPGTNELTLIIAVRDGAVFQNGSATVAGITYTVEGSADLAFPGAAVSSTGPSDTAPAATGLPSLAGTDWEYHTFKLDSSEGLAGRGFLRLKVTQP